MVIILFSTALCRSAFSTVSFEKLVFRLSLLSVFFVLNQMFRIKTLKYVLSCYAILLCDFVLTLCKNSPLINTKEFLKILLDSMFSESFLNSQKIRGKKREVLRV